jgi:cytochrome oxidase Cu insertion factor (SCO1/SenC/PrrC family)
MRNWLLTGFLLLAALAPGWSQQANPQAPPMKLKVGETAPDFTLKDQNGNNVSLHDFHGKKSVVLAFYIFAFSGG